MEMYSDDDADPSEIYFGDHREVEGRQLPHRWEIRHGDSTFAVLQMKKYQFKKPAEK
jgi:hypothetical protein